MINQTEPKTTHEELHITGENLLTTVKRLIHEGNVRRIIIKQDEHTILELPLSAGVVGVVLAPALVAIGAISALLTNCSIEVERIDPTAGMSTPEFEQMGKL